MKSSQRLTKDAGGEEVYEELDALKSSFNQLRGDVVDLVSHAFGISKGGAHVAQASASDAVDQLKSKLSELRERGGEGVAAIGQQIEERPIHAAMIAFGVGFLAAMLISRK